MTTPTLYYVDPSLGSDTGDGTVGTPWGRASGSVVQYALNTGITTRDATNGDQINVKSDQAVGVTTTTDDTLAAALDFSTYGASGFGNPLIIRGYTSAANDGGIGGIDGAATYGIQASSIGHHYVDMHLHNCGSATVLTLGNYCVVLNCELDNTSGGGIDCSGSGNYVIGCHLHDIGGIGIDGGFSAARIMRNYLKNGTKDFSSAIYLSSTLCVVTDNIVSVDGTSNGINCASWGVLVQGNSILGGGSTGKGIIGPATGLGQFLNNLVEGFSGSGGVGINLTALGDVFVYGHNGTYNNATEYSVTSDVHIDLGDNEELAASPFAQSGADTFANRFVFFSPVDTDNVHGGAYVGS